MSLSAENLAPANGQAIVPKFEIPELPKLVPIPVPKPAKKLPPVGYDMRTLRKQMDALYAEIEERANWQRIMFTQNEQLSEYAGALLQSNKSNIAAMKQQLQRLHEECLTLHQERQVLRNKLADIQNAQQLIDTIGDEVNRIDSELLGVAPAAGEQKGGISSDSACAPVDARAGTASAHVAPVVIEGIPTKDMNILRYRATEAIAEARHEMEEVEFELHDKSSKLSEMRGQLDAYRESLIESTNNAIADKFFCTSYAVLRSAYGRFRGAIKQKLRHHHIANKLARVYGELLKTKYLEQWGAYLRKCRFARYHTARREQALVLLCMEEWKVFVALQQYTNRSYRRRVLGHYWGAWAGVVRDATVRVPMDTLPGGADLMRANVLRLCDGEDGERRGLVELRRNPAYYDRVVGYMQGKQTMRRFFREWQQVCVRSGRLWLSKADRKGFGESSRLRPSSAAYLSWNGPEVAAVEQKVQPRRVFLCTLLKHWRRVAAEDREREDALMAAQLPWILARAHFKAWRECCIHLWSHRSKLVHRFFQHATLHLHWSGMERNRVRRAMVHHMQLGQRRCLQRWWNFVQTKQRFGSSGSSLGVSRSVSAFAASQLAARKSASAAVALDLASTRAHQSVVRSASTPAFRLRESDLLSSSPLAHDDEEDMGSDGHPDSRWDSRLSLSAFGHGAGMRSLGPLSNTPTVGGKAGSALASFRNIRLLRQAVHQWHAHSLVRRRRQKTSDDLACKYHKQYLCSFRGIYVWRAHVSNEIQFRMATSRRVFGQCITLWREYVQQMRREKANLRKLARFLFEHRHRRILKRCWGALAQCRLHGRRCRRSRELVQSKAAHSRVRQHFRRWKNRWSHQLFWKIQELVVENRKVGDLVGLYNSEMCELDKEREQLLRSAEQYQEQLGEYTQLLLNKETVAKQQEERNRRQAEEIAALGRELEAANGTLEVVQAERARLVSVEQILLDESTNQERLMQQQKEQSEQVIAQLQAETQTLQSEIKQLSQGERGELVYALESNVKGAVRKELDLLRELQELNDRLRAEEAERTEVLSQLEDTRRRFEQEMAIIGNRLKLVHAMNQGSHVEGEPLVTGLEGELVVQSKEAHIRHLEEQVRQYDVNISSSAGMIRSRRAELAQLRKDLEAAEEQSQAAEIARARQLYTAADAGAGGNHSSFVAKAAAASASASAVPQEYETEGEEAMDPTARSVPRVSSTSCAASSSASTASISSRSADNHSPAGAPVNDSSTSDSYVQARAALQNVSSKLLGRFEFGDASK